MCLAGETEKRRLDSSVKRNTAVLKKLRQLSEDSSASILEDLHKVNQTKVHTFPPLDAVQSSSRLRLLAGSPLRAQKSSAAASSFQPVVAWLESDAGVLVRGCSMRARLPRLWRRRPSCPEMSQLLSRSVPIFLHARLLC